MGYDVSDGLAMEGSLRALEMALKTEPTPRHHQYITQIEVCNIAQMNTNNCYRIMTLIPV